MLNNVGIIILAAGQGKRLGCADKPKVLYEIGGEPIVSYVLKELERGGMPKENICLVVGFCADQVMEKFGSGYLYPLQQERLGTAHAAHTGEEVLPENIDTILTIQGDDSAFYKHETILNLIDYHLKHNHDLTLLTCEVADPTALGRVIRDEEGKMIEVVEKENLKPGQELIKEISTGTYCFNREWFKNIYPTIGYLPVLNEIVLPSFVEEAKKRGARYDAMKLADSNEWFGVNTPEQLAEADRRKRLSTGF